MGKTANGLIRGYKVDFGHYSQCSKLQGKFCKLRFHWPLLTQDRFDVERVNLSGTKESGKWLEKLASDYKTFYFETFLKGICIPRACNQEELGNLANRLIKERRLPLKAEMRCEEKEQENIALRSSYAMAISKSFFLAVLIAVLIGSFVARQESFHKFPYAHDLDIISNTRRLLAAEAKASNLSFFNGFRFLYFINSIIGHVKVVVSFYTPDHYCE